MPAGSLPEVVYIGNMRSGSAFVRSFLGAHPETHWTRRAWYFQLGSSDDERRQTYPRFFEGVPEGRVHVDMYESLFLGQYFRSSPRKEYLDQGNPEWDSSWAVAPDHDLSEGPMGIDPREVARRVAACAPRAKVLIVIREQVSWMQSMFRHYLAYLPKRRRTLADFSSTLDGQAAWRALRYDDYVEPYLDLFGHEAVHVTLLEDVARDAQTELDRLCEFLGVARFQFDRALWWRNEGMTAERASRLRYGRLRGLFRRRDGDRGGALTVDEIASVREASAESNRRLQELLGVDLGRLGYSLQAEAVAGPVR
jgi:hypothetical protein